ncbi:MAG: DUF5011 domain-containing protein, partial [Firmicutes bacterium]|nr:DUF5011 domain-containing protein [Bacillota bacterium]
PLVPPITLNAIVKDKAGYPGGTPAVVGDYTPIKIGVDLTDSRIKAPSAGDPVKAVNGKVIDKDVIAGPTDPTPGDGDNTRYVVAANNVTLKLNEAQSYVGLTPAAKQLLIAKAEAVGYIITSTTADYEVDVLTNGIPNPPVKGVYPVTFIPKGQPTIKATVNFTIESTPPEIKFQEAPLVVPATPGASHIMTQTELKAKMTVTDMNTGTSLLAQTTATPAIPVDTQNVGVTKVTYSVTDNDGNNATATRAVVVDDGRYVIKDTDGDGTNDVILGAKNYVISSTATDWSMVKAKALSYAEAYAADGTPINANDITWTHAPAGYQAGAPEGNYPITWQVPSPAGGTVTKDIKAIVKNADVIDQGTKDSQYAIAANNFKVNQTEADAVFKGTPQTFINKAQAVVIKLVDSAPDKGVFLSTSGQFGLILDPGNGLPAQGVYGPKWTAGQAGSADPIRFLIEGISATVQKADITGTISQGNPPVIITHTPLEIWIGPAADKPAGAITAAQYTAVANNLYDVAATDIEDDAATPPIALHPTVTANGAPVDVTKVDTYKQNISVTDSDGNTVTAKRVVVVNDGTYVVGKGRILAAKSFVAKLSDVTSVSSQINQEILSRSRTALYDGETGAPIQETSVQDTGGYTKQEGVYPGIKVAGVDSPASNPLIMKTITGKVVDRDVLVITPDPQVESKPTYYAYGNNLQLTPVQAQAIVDAANPAQALLDALKAGADMTQPDGTLKALTVKIASDANGFLTKAYYIGGAATTNMGTYNVIIGDTGNNVTAPLTVQVGTGGFPTINADSPKVFPVNLNNTGNLTEAQLRDKVTASDPEDGDLTGAIKIGTLQSGTFTQGVPAIPANKASVTQVTYQVTDSAGNTATKSVAVIVDDGSFVYDSKYILRAQSFVIGLSEVKGDLQQQILNKSNARAWQTDGTPATASVDSLGGYAAEVGDWHPTIIVSGYPAVFRQITARVYDDGPGEGGGNGGNGDIYSIIAQNFRVNLTDAAALASGTDAALAAAFVQRSGAESYLRADAGLQKSGTPALATGNGGALMDGGFKAAGPAYTEGQTFTATFWVNEDHTATTTVTVIVSNGQSPVIKAPFTQIWIADPNSPKRPANSILPADYNPMTGVSATDAEDQNITNKVKYGTGGSAAFTEKAAPVDFTKAGFQTVTYTVTDSDYNTVYKDASVLVNDGTWVVEGCFAVRAQDFVTTVDNATGSDSEILTLSGAEAAQIMTDDGAGNVTPLV